MNMNSVLSELLYLVANYEKGKNKKITKKYIDSLHESINAMKFILSLMRRDGMIESFELHQITNFIKKREGEIFAIGFSNRFSNACKNCNNLQSKNYSDQHDLLVLMENIVEECDVMVSSKSKNKDEIVTYLFYALHNIPRAFMTDISDRIATNISCLSNDEAENLARYYLQLSKRYQ